MGTLKESSEVAGVGLVSWHAGSVTCDEVGHSLYSSFLMGWVSLSALVFPGLVEV